MSGARGDALEWALALAQSPGERESLRRRPLPEGVGALLQIASGSHGDALQAAMRRTGESEAKLVEAARFYLREVLFHGGADAYRTLGLTRDAAHEQIKAHHRLLQHWLHPDRYASDLDAVFAGRINAAWNALRTPERRAAYDAARPRTDLAPTELLRHGTPRVVPPVPVAIQSPGERWRRRAPVLVLFAACGMLGIAAVRESLREPDTGYAEAPARPAPGPIETVALQLPRSSPEPRLETPPAPRVQPRAPAPVAVAPALADVASRVPQPVAVRVASRARPGVPATSDARPSEPAAPTVRPAPQSLSQAPVTARVPTSSGPPAAPKRPPAAEAIAPAAPQKAITESPAASATAARVQLAQRTGDQLLAFLSGTGKSIPPIWHSLAAQQRAVAVRDQVSAARVAAGDPTWRVADREAVVRVRYADGAEVRAQFVWRDQRWLVSGVSLEQ